MLGLELILSHPRAKEDPVVLPLSKLAFVLRHLELSNKITALLSFSSLAVLISVRLIKQFLVKRPGGRWVRFVPEILLVVAGTTGMSGSLV
jgi:nitrate/nitrite transporter NarK